MEWPSPRKVPDQEPSARDSAKTSIYDVLHAGAARCAASAAILALGRPFISYARLLGQVEGVVAWLNAAGIGRGDRVAIVLRNGPEMATAFLGVSAGAVSAPLNPGYRAEDFDFYLAGLKAKALIIQRGTDSPVLAIARKRGMAIIELAPTLDAEAGIFN